MTLNPSQQFQKLINESQDILILLPHQLQGDALASAWALAHVLETQNKTVTVAADNLFHTQDTYTFLPSPNHRVESLSGARDFILSFNTKYNKIHGIRSEQDNEEFRVYITPEHGTVDPRDFSFIPAQFKYDCVIVLGAPNKESLGKLYETNADIFYEIPVINIDHHAKNTQFGQINFTNSAASSTSEILTDILQQSMLESITATVAECLLTGIITATESFQKKNTTPKSLVIASWLMQQGADQQRIILHLFKTQPLALLKLWGAIMSDLQLDEQTDCVWAHIRQETLDTTNTTSADLPVIVEKIKILHSSATYCILFYIISEETIQCIIQCATQEKLDIVIRLLPGGELADDIYTATFNGLSLDAVENDIFSRLRTDE